MRQLSIIALVAALAACGAKGGGGGVVGGLDIGIDTLRGEETGSDTLPGWRPEWSGHPRLIFGPEDLPELRARAQVPGEVHGIMLSRIEAAAAAVPESQPPDEILSPYIAAKRARIAKAAAFLALVNGDPDMADLALELLTTIRTDVDEVQLGTPNLDHYTIHMGEALASYALAADWLLGSDLVDGSDAASVEASVIGLALAFEANLTGGPLLVVVVGAQNNHTIKAFASLALAGMTFNQNPAAARLVDRGVSNAMHVLLEVQTTEDGGYAEGPAYLNYGAGEFWPLLWALHRVSGGEPLRFDNWFDGRLQRDSPDVLELPDPADIELLRLQTRWPLALAMPSGDAPNIDDSGLALWCGAPFGAVLWDDPELYWLWHRQGLVSSGGSILAPELFAILPDPVPAGAEPAWTDILLEASGHAVFRDGWDPDATWLMLLGEHGQARTMGLGHEHPDATHVLLAAHGEYLLVDSGYIGYSQKEPVCHAEDHSLVLVDGEGPPDNYKLGMVGADAWLTDWDTQNSWKTVVSTTSYAGADRARRVVLFPEGWLVIHDRISADEEHQWDWLLQGHAGGSTGGNFAALAAGGRWTRPGAWVQAEVVTTGGAPDCGHHEGEVSLHHSGMETHEVLGCAWDGPAADILALVRFGPAHAPPPADAVVAWNPGQATLSFAGTNGSVVVVAREPGAGGAVVTGCGSIPADGDLQVVVCGEEDEPPVTWAW